MFSFGRSDGLGRNVIMESTLEPTLRALDQEIAVPTTKHAFGGTP
jgi:hypothetical protein